MPNSSTYSRLDILSLVCQDELKQFSYCYICKITYSPLWRKGQCGQKTLCNSCGLKYSRKLQKNTRQIKEKNLFKKLFLKRN